jgi:hypothetical protein
MLVGQLFFFVSSPAWRPSKEILTSGVSWMILFSYIRFQVPGGRKMAEQTQKSAKAGVQGVQASALPIENPDQVRPVYSNSFGAGATMTDFTLFFTLVNQMPGVNGPVPSHELKAAVTVPLTLAAPLIQVLQQVIQNHQSLVAQSKVVGSTSAK